MRCSTCGQPGTVWAVQKEDWRVCGPCHEQWRKDNAWTKVEGEFVRILIDAGAELPPCKECGNSLEPEGARLPILFVTKDGEIISGYCRGCVERWRAEKAEHAVRERIMERIDLTRNKERSKGLLTKELMKEGLRISDIRLAFEMLIDEKRLIQEKGMVRFPSFEERHGEELSYLRRDLARE